MGPWCVTLYQVCFDILIGLACGAMVKESWDLAEWCLFHYACNHASPVVQRMGSRLFRSVVRRLEWSASPSFGQLGMTHGAPAPFEVVASFGAGPATWGCGRKNDWFQGFSFCAGVRQLGVLLKKAAR